MRWRLVSGVPEEEVRRLLSVARRRRFARGEIVFHGEDPADSLHLVARGRFAVRIMTPRGESTTVAVRGPGGELDEPPEHPPVGRHGYAGGEVPLTQEQLAELAGTSRATVNQVLRQEQEKGTLELRRGRTLVLRPDELARRAR